MIRNGILLKSAILLCSGVTCAGLAITALAPNDCKATARHIERVNAGRVTLNSSDFQQLEHQIDIRAKICENIDLPLPPLATRSPSFPKP